MTVRDSKLDRRDFLAGGAAGVAWLTLPGAARGSGGRRPRFDRYPFSLGVASGEPGSSQVVLWTRLAPSPFEPDGGMPPTAMAVRWQLAWDEGFRRVVQEGVEWAVPELAHSVHAEVMGLQPGAEYFYRFLAGDAVSRVGRTRTLPRHDAHVEQMALAVTCCARFEDGYYVAYRDMAEADLDLVVHVGDYIYENFDASGVRVAQVPAAQQITVTDLTGYRMRHALGKTDLDLQAAHAAHPWAMILDNHDAVDDDHRDPATLARRAAAYQAYYEHLPMRRRSLPHGPDMRIYHRIRVGDLVELDLLDTRQFKDDQTLCGSVKAPNIGPICPGAQASDRTMLGDAQERWLAAALAGSQARWNAIVQTVLFAPFDFTPDDPAPDYYLTSWNGYPAGRQRIVDAIGEIKPSNPLMFSGDWHTAWVNDLAADASDPDSPTELTEFSATAVSSDPAFTADLSRPAVSANRDVRFYDEHNGYIRCHLDHASWRNDFVIVDATDPHAAASVIGAWTLEDGQPAAHSA